MAKRWERSEAVVAQRISIFQVGGLFSKKVSILDNEAAFLEEDGKPLRALGKGVHKVAGLFSGSKKSIAFIDLSPKTIRRDVKDLWTKDDREIYGSIEMRLTVSDKDKVLAVMMAGRDLVTLDIIWEAIKPSVVGSALEPIVKKKGIDQLQGERKAAKEVQVAAEVELRKKLDALGLSLLAFDASFVLPEDYKKYLERRGALKEESERNSMALEDEEASAIKRRETGEIDGSVEDREHVIDSMQKERIRREAEMALESEEDQEDVKDAVEALRLKEVMDRQRQARAKQEAGSSGVSRRDAEKRLKELRSLMKETERKYLKRQMDEGAFKGLMQKYQEEKAELELRARGD